ncbi:MAG: type pili twitching motility protein PilT [Glaciihabitans sp.]|nr:type pili twitching motility protein PilT [Glaciihabitans sp.]
MSNPIYEIPVNDDSAPGLNFPPPSMAAGPASFSPAPPTMASAPAPTGWPLPPVQSSPLPPQGFPAPAPMTFQVPSVPDAGWPAPSAAAAYPVPTAAPVYEVPVVPSPSIPTAPVVYELPVSAPSAPVAAPLYPLPNSVPSAPSAEHLNFPPPSTSIPARHTDDIAAATAGLPERVVDFGEDVTNENADPDLITALRDVLMMNASDLHVTANMPPMVRVDGGLTPSSFTQAWDAEKVRHALRSIMTPAQAEIFDRDLELDFAYTVSANARFRVNFYQQREAMGAAFRLIPTEIKQLADLGVPDSIARFATLARGLVLVTGPTGSGKSTTLAALVDLVNRTRADHIMTVEDPIEFLHGNHKSLVNQREVGNDTHSFGAALKHVLRQDPDVILIGELRDLETISVALTAAETGHLVFATLHTQDAAQTIDRIIDVFPPHQQGQVRSQLAATLQGVVCQTLVKKASGRGRVVATEVLIATPAVANLIREGKTYQIASAMQAGGELGMHTMDRHLADLVNAGMITQRAALDKAQDVESIKQLIHRVDSTEEAAMSASEINFDAYSGMTP